jgi:hypothetical protein
MVMRSRHAVWQSRGRKGEGEEGEESGSALPEFRGIIKWVGSLLCDFRTAKVSFGLLPGDEQRKEFVRVFKRRER